MPVFFLCIILSFVMYLFYKTQYFRATTPALKQWLSAKSSIALGAFVVLFGVNYQFINFTTVSVIVGLLFLFFGGGSIWNGIKAYRYYLPLAIKEREKGDIS